MSVVITTDQKEQLWTAQYAAELASCLLDFGNRQAIRRAEKIRRHLKKKLGVKQGRRVIRTVERVVGE